MARALIVGCGCRGRALGRALIDEGWVVRGTTREEVRLDEIAADGIDAVSADPDRIGTILDHIEGVAVVFWLLGTAQAEPEVLAAIHGPRLERLLDELIDTPVRAFVYEASGTVQDRYFRDGREIVERFESVHRIPGRVVEADPSDYDSWLAAMVAASTL